MMFSSFKFLNHYIFTIKVMHFAICNLNVSISFFYLILIFHRNVALLSTPNSL